MADRREPTQRTQPKKGKPAEIHVPKRGDVTDDLRKVAKKPQPTDLSDGGRNIIDISF
jgi:hypothetical protein